MWSVAARGATLVAVGTDGDPTYGPAAAWVSTDGTWRRAEVASPDGVMRAVTSTADGFVAVGYATTDDGARVWRSADGTTWTPGRRPGVAGQPLVADPHALRRRR